MHRKHNEAIFVAAFATAMLSLFANRLILPGIDRIVSTRPAGTYVSRRLPPDEVAVYRLPRAAEYGLNYYFNVALPEWTPDNTKAKIVICSRDALGSPRLGEVAAEDKGPLTGDGKIFFVILPHPAEK